MNRTSHFFATLFRFFGHTILNGIILLFIGGLSVILTFEISDYFTDVSKGVNNIPIIIGAFTFFPLLNSFFVIFLIQERRRKKQILKKTSF